MRTVEGTAPFRRWQTWYRVTGRLDGLRPPLVVLHGGPGCTHEYVNSLADIAETGRAVVHYDQIGNGRSTHLPEMGGDFWTVELFLDELDSLLAHLGIDGRYAIFGQSWGGMLAAEHAVRRPTGLTALVIANSPASMDLWVREAGRLRAALPADVQATLARHEADGTTTDPEYQKATRVFYDRHVCRIDPWPDDAARTFAAIEKDPTVYTTMNGANEFFVTGTLRRWTIIDRLDRIAAPTLVMSGRHDEATEACVRPFAERIGGAEWQVFEHSSHMPHIEEREACMARVADFLDRHA